MAERLPPLADVLERVMSVATDGVVQSADLGRADRERLVRSGWLEPIIRGWYLLSQPSDELGLTTAWYGSYWAFVARYLAHRFGEDYCLSAESSLDLHLGSNRVPDQLVVVASKGGAGVVNLLAGASILTYQDESSLPEQTTTIRGIRVMTLELALVKVTPSFFTRRPHAAELAIRLLGDPSALARTLVARDAVAASERLAGAFIFFDEPRKADQIRLAMRAAGRAISPANPFERETPVFDAGVRLRSPWAGRVTALWNASRDTVAELCPAPVTPRRDLEHVLAEIDAVHVEDAYHSLSIEGYQVTPDLIGRIRDGKWSPTSDLGDRNQRDAMAAKGYLDAFRLVRAAIAELVNGSDPRRSIVDAVPSWYAALFGPSVDAGILEPHHLAGYRSDPVYIRGSRHVPPPARAVGDAMEAFGDAFCAEPEPAVRAILGHFLFVYVHPYPDGNGRLARFIMNATLASAGYPWTIIETSRRRQYMEALETASIKNDPRPFAELVLGRG